MGLEKLLYLQGVGSEFIDCFGQLVHIPSKDRQGILTSMLAKTSLYGLTEQQLSYAANDVRYLISLKDKLIQMLKREERWELAEKCFENQMSNDLLAPRGHACYNRKQIKEIFSEEDLHGTLHLQC